MKVLLINGSPNAKGCTFLALSEVAKILNSEGIETEIVQTGNKPVRDCIGCGGCVGKGQCIFNDDCANEIILKARESDGFIFGTPVYYAHPSGRLLSIMDRLFYAGGDAFAQKPAASIATLRRAGSTSTLDVVNKHISNCGMPLIGSSYWNMVFGPKPDKIEMDAEGLQTMQNLGKNMAWILKCIEDGKKSGHLPPKMLKELRTNFNK